MINDDKNLDFSCKMNWLDDIYLGTKESQGIRNAASAIKFVLFDDISVLPDGLKYNDKYEFISARRGGRSKAKMLTETDLIQILCKYAMQSFGINDKSFSLGYDDYLNVQNHKITCDYTPDFAVVITAFACLDNIYTAYNLLKNNKELKLTLVNALINERYVENKMLMLNRFDGMLVSGNISAEDKEKYLDNFMELDNYFYKIKTRNQEYLEYINSVVNN